MRIRLWKLWTIALLALCAAGGRLPVQADPPTPARLDALWADLGSSDEAKSARAVLPTMAEAVPDAPPTRAASEALGRLNR
jgi:hypothetical protein